MDGWGKVEEDRCFGKRIVNTDAGTRPNLMNLINVILVPRALFVV